MSTNKMSPPRLAFLLALFALFAACTTPPTAPVSVAGAWTSITPGKDVPPEALLFVLTESGDSVSGTGQWGPQTYQISGRYMKPAISLIFVFQGDTIERFKGNVEGGKMIGASLSPQGVVGASVNYYRE